MAPVAPLAVRAIALGALFILAVARSREAQPLRARVTPMARAGVAVVLILMLTALVPAFGLTSRHAERAVLALVAKGEEYEHISSAKEVSAA